MIVREDPILGHVGLQQDCNLQRYLQSTVFGRRMFVACLV